MNLKPLRKGHDESRAFSSLLNIFGFVDESTFITKGGDLGLVIRFRGFDSECREPQFLDNVVSSIRTALLSFSDRFVIEQHLLKTARPDLVDSACDNEVVREAIQNRNDYLRLKGADLYTFETYLVIICRAEWESPQLTERLAFFLRYPRKALRRFLNTTSRISELDETVESTRKLLHRAVKQFLEQTADSLSGRILSNSEAFSFFRRLVNPCPVKAAATQLAYNTHVDFFVPDSELEAHPDHLRLDNYFVKTLTLKHPPSSTQADLLRALLRISGNVRVSTSWNFLDNAVAQALVRSKRRHFHNTKSSMWNGALSDRPVEREILFDESKEALVVELGRCQEQMNNGLRLGELSLTVVLTGEHFDRVEQSVAEVMKVFGAFEGALTEERYNGLNAFLASIPAGYPFNLRKLVCTDQNHSDLGFWFLPSDGERENGFLGADNLITLETEDRSLFHFNLHVGDVGHTLVIGPTGTGKSFALNALLVNAQRYNAVTVIFDVGGSYYSPTKLVGGSHVQVRPDAIPFSINPFALAPTPKNLEFLASLFSMLAVPEGKLGDSDHRDLFEAIRSIYFLEPEQRRLLTLSTTVKPHLGEHLRRWTEGEQYGRWFDNPNDTVSFARFQCIDFEGMERMGVVLEPLLFYLLFRVDELIYDPREATTFKVFVADEAWRFFKHPVTRAYIVEAMRTWRKKNAAVILATQSVEDVAGSEDLRPIIESCPTKLLFGNPNLNAALYCDAFGLNETELERLRRLTPKKQFLLKREGLSKVLNLNVDPRSHWLFTTNPYEAEKREKALKEHGSLRAALRALAGENK